MNILIISSFLPYPLFSGGHIRLYNIIKELSKGHKITLICEKRKYQTENDVKEVRKICEAIWVERKKQWSIKNILKAGFSSYPFLMAGHTNSQMRKRIEDVLKQKKFDVIHIETFYVMQNMPKVDIPTVLAEHNIEYLVYKRFADSSSKLIKPFLLLDILKMQYWEKKFWKKATKLVAVSEQEKKMMIRKDVIVVQNGVDLNKFSSKGRSAFGR
ncbi:MAG: glycosyltransferase [bacterium]|nr:glycosyltransferase [bacterium]